MKNKTKKRMFITAGTFTTAVAAALIRQLGNKNCENYLVSIAPTLYENVDKHLQDLAKQTNLFNGIYFYFDYCLPKHNFSDEKKHILSFNFEQFKEAIGNVEFDEIYSVYIHGAANNLFNHYPNANLYFMEDGIAAYLKMDNAKKINDRAKKIYTLNYLNKVKPHVSLYEGVTTKTIDKDLVKSVFEEFTSNIQFDLEKREKSVIFCAQNISLNKVAMSYKNELKLYTETIKKILEKGYTVYFKEHPKTPNMFFKDLRHNIKSPNLINIGTYNVLPIEFLVPLLNPTAIVSMFSSALFTVPHIFKTPAYTFFAENEFTKHRIFGIAHLMAASYIPTVDLISDNPIETKQAFEKFIQNQPEIQNQVIYRIAEIDHFKLFIPKREFKKLKKLFKENDKNLLKYANLPAELVDIFENQTYMDYLMHYAESFKMQYTAYLEHQKRKNSFGAVVDLLVSFFKVLAGAIF